MDIKIRNKILVVGFVFLLFVVYKLAISKTIETRSSVSKLLVEKKLLSNVTAKIAQLKLKEYQLDSILKSYNLSIDNSFQQTLLQKVTEFSKKEKLQIIQFKEPHIFIDNEANRSTYSFELKGNFISLLKIVNYLEDLQLGQLISINFVKRKNYRANTNYLTCEILLQKVNN